MNPIKNVLTGCAVALGILVAAPAHAATANPLPDNLASFNKMFVASIAYAHQHNIEFDRSEDPTAVGWEQTFAYDDQGDVIRIDAFLGLGTTFTIKHMCFGNKNISGYMLCVSNLGESWEEKKDANGNWQKYNSMNLSWSREFSKVAYD
jgi:hypothetical protein